MNQYITLAVVNFVWFAFVILILNAFHRLRLKFQDQIDTLNHKRNQENEAAEKVADCRRQIQKLADERALKIDALTKQLRTVEDARERYVNDVLQNEHTISDLKKELETAHESILKYEVSFNDMSSVIGERDAKIAELEQRAERITLECSRRANEVVKLQRACDHHRAEETRLSKLLNEANARTRDSDIAHDQIAAKFTRLRNVVSGYVQDLQHKMGEFDR